MKKITKIIPLLLIFIVCTNCTANKQNQASHEFDTSDQLFADAMDSASTPADSDVAVEPLNTLEIGHVDISEAPVAPIFEEPVSVNAQEMSENIPQVETFITEAPVVIKANDPGIYEVRRGDTWMIISQKLLGNPLKWRQIQKMNKEFKKSSDLRVGAKLAYIVPENPIVEPEGLPYLIKNADTLPKISKKVYGTKNSWDVIYFNNREVIKSPDVIYSGFMLYYPEVQRVPMMKIEMAQMGFNSRGPRKPASVKTKK